MAAKLTALYVPETSGLRVHAYKNLNSGCWSVRDPSTGRVVAHVAEVELSGVEFRVQQGARARVLREKCRSVHAYVVGALVYAGESRGLPPRGLTRCTYNPYRAGTFTVADPSNPAPVVQAARVRLDAAGAWFQA